MVEEIFTDLPRLYKKDLVKTATSYYFTMGDIKKTVQLDPEKCSVENGKTIESADCVCKTTTEFFLKIWNEGYRPGLKDFMSGAIKSNKPDALKDFLAAFGKE